MTWSKGQPWRPVRSLDRLNAQIRAAHPRAVPPATPAASWGSIADSAHSTSSDHYPHYYSALGAVAVVCARDFPHAPDLGLDFGEVAEALRRSKDPRIKYTIFDGRMFSSYPAYGYAPYTWRPYSGPDMHRTHGHVSSVHTAAADDQRDWQIGEDDMPTIDEIWHYGAREYVDEAKDGTRDSRTVLDILFATHAAAVRAQAGVSALLGRDMTDEAEVARLVLAGLPAEKIAAAIPAQMAKDVADELGRRMVS